mmetsp:Transcript_1308/g.4289  ORF Transcript_1308/g.4289 Transcript_1308/m.4289 type:complete len:220 (+) Transcript_1308:334-993(+)|eukprot:scaffold293363_cov28-Tisochrysis_lutea.AAC.1
MGDGVTVGGSEKGASDGIWSRRRWAKARSTTEGVAVGRWPPASLRSSYRGRQSRRSGDTRGSKTPRQQGRLSTKTQGQKSIADATKDQESRSKTSGPWGRVERVRENENARGCRAARAARASKSLLLLGSYKCYTIPIAIARALGFANGVGHRIHTLPASGEFSSLRGTLNAALRGVMPMESTAEADAFGGIVDGASSWPATLAGARKCSVTFEPVHPP